MEIPLFTAILAAVAILIGLLWRNMLSLKSNQEAQVALLRQHIAFLKDKKGDHSEYASKLALIKEWREAEIERLQYEKEAYFSKGNNEKLEKAINRWETFKELSNPFHDSHLPDRLEIDEGTKLLVNIVEANFGHMLRTNAWRVVREKNGWLIRKDEVIQGLLKMFF